MAISSLTNKGKQAYSAYQAYAQKQKNPALAQANALYPATPPGQLRGQAQQTVNSFIAPILANIRNTITGQTKAGQAAIKGLTETYSQRLGNLDAGIEGSYHAAKQQTAGINDALSSYLKGQGGTLAAGLGSNAPFDLGAMGAAAGGAQMAAGGAGLENLIGQETSAHTYAKSLPGYAAGYGLMQDANYQQQQGLSLNKAIGDVSAQVPGIVSSTYQSLLDREQANASARGSFYSSALDRQQSAVLAAKQQAATAALAASQQASDASIAAANRAENLKESQLQIAAQDRQTAATKRNTVQDQRNFDSTARETKREFDANLKLDREKMLLTKKAAKTGNITAKDVDGIYQQAVSAAQQMLNPTDANGLPIPTVKPTVNRAAYAKIYNFLKGSPLSNGLSPAEVLTMTRHALVTAGYNKASTAPAKFFTNAPKPQPKPQPKPKPNAARPGTADGMEVIQLYGKSYVKGSSAGHGVYHLLEVDPKTGRFTGKSAVGKP